MDQGPPTQSEDLVIRKWLETTHISASTREQFQADDIEVDIEDDVPKASSILSKRRRYNGYYEYQDDCADSVANMHLLDLTLLYACFSDMHVLLQRIGRDIHHLSCRKDGATKLVLNNPELPGIDILAALKATNLVLQNTVDSNVSGISDFMEMLSGMRQTMEGNQRQSTKKPAYWSPGLEVDAWNIALPGDDLFKGDRVQDPLTPPAKGFTLEYHDDIKDIDSPRLFVSSLSAAQKGPQSRRVVLDNLPGDTTTSQVFKCIRCYGGTVSLALTNSLCRLKSGKRTAIVEFVYPEAASDVVSYLHKNKIIFLDKEGNEHQPESYLVPTASYYHTEVNHCLLDKGCTRALCMPNFPEGAIWHLLCNIGTRHISHVQLSDDNNLVVEFTSLFETNQAEKLVRFGNMAIEYDPSTQGMCHVPDSSQGTMQDVHDSTKGTILYIEPNVLETTWNQAPFNTYHPVQTPAGTPSSQGTNTKVHKPTNVTHEDILAEYLSVDPSEVWSYLEDRRSFQDTTYKIIGSTIELTRHKWSWSISAEDDLKLVMANTLHDPDWADVWDEYFRAKGTVNLRTWEEYGLLAKHRRDCAAEQGLAEGTVPTCKGCSWGCRDLKSVPVPELVQDYSVFRRVQKAGD
ncbi:hypothetical protein ED733_000386 [Metarhizium rileyi]|uniref:Nucleotide-binding, alpha-beta plait n=1 Tax=Metarhizium rileyi (strain RCEF 4871) TaxID=1649241 RepID=A0A5C6G1H1_METRR|nr:hypothetical protein ED733_000386 [Metarhizium rileyi]